MWPFNNERIVFQRSDLNSCVAKLSHCFLFPQMSNITVTYRDGRVAQLEQVYIRGSKIRFLILPDMLKNAPMLKSMKNKNQGSGAGRGKAAILKAQGELTFFFFYGILEYFRELIVYLCFYNDLGFHSGKRQWRVTTWLWLRCCMP